MTSRKVKQLEGWGEIAGHLALLAINDGDNIYAISLETLNVIDVMCETVQTVLSWYKSDNVIFILVTVEDN